MGCHVHVRRKIWREDSLKIYLTRQKTITNFPSNFSKSLNSSNCEGFCI